MNPYKKKPVIIPDVFHCQSITSTHLYHNASLLVIIMFNYSSEYVILSLVKHYHTRHK